MPQRRIGLGVPRARRRGCQRCDGRARAPSRRAVQMSSRWYVQYGDVGMVLLYVVKHGVPRGYGLLVHTTARCVCTK